VSSEEMAINEKKTTLLQKCNSRLNRASLRGFVSLVYDRIKVLQYALV